MQYQKKNGAKCNKAKAKLQCESNRNQMSSVIYCISFKITKTKISSWKLKITNLSHKYKQFVPCTH